MGGVTFLPGGFDIIISLVAPGSYSTSLTVGQTHTRTQNITPRIPHEPWTPKFPKTIGTGVCDFGPSVRDFLIHCGSDSQHDLPQQGPDPDRSECGGCSLLIWLHRLQSIKIARLSECDLNSSHQNQHHLSAARSLWQTRSKRPSQHHSTQLGPKSHSAILDLRFVIF